MNNNIVWLVDFFIGPHSMQDWTAIMKHGVTKNKKKIIK